MKIIGYTIKQGTFNENEYHNINIYVISPVEKDGQGYKSEFIKVKKSKFDEILKLNGLDYNTLINKTIKNIYYNKFSQIEAIYFN